VILGGSADKLTWQAVTCPLIWREAGGKGDKSTWQAQLVKFHLLSKHRCRTRIFVFWNSSLICSVVKLSESLSGLFEISYVESENRGVGGGGRDPKKQQEFWTTDKKTQKRWISWAVDVGVWFAARGSHELIDWCCFYYFVRNSLVALLEALCARIFLFRFVNVVFFSEKKNFEALSPLNCILPQEAVELHTVPGVWCAFIFACF